MEVVREYDLIKLSGAHKPQLLFMDSKALETEYFFDMLKGSVSLLI